MSLRSLFFNHVAQTSPEPLALEVDYAHGSHLFTADGRAIVDLISGISVSSLGHGHPGVVAAVQAQAARYMHTLVYGELVQAPQVHLAEALAESTGGVLDAIYFTSAGGEAVEGALKLAKRATGRYDVVACKAAYHGSTHGALAAGGEGLKGGYLPLVPGFRHIRHGEVDDLALITDRTAAFIIEPVQGEAGVRQADAAYWQAVRARCQATGALLIFDEIQTGFGRTGTFWHAEQLGFWPDILITAKAMGGGMPLGGFMARREVMAVLSNNPVLGNISTFGGHPVCCAASLAALKAIQAEGLPAQAAAKGAHLARALAQAGAVRHAGLLMALELGSFARVRAVLADFLAQGYLSDWFLYCDTAIRLAPPLNIADELLTSAVQVINDAVGRVPM